MNIYRFFITSIILFVTINLSSQTVFSKFYDIENRVDFGMEIKYKNGNYYIYGKGTQLDTLLKTQHLHEYLAIIDSNTLEIKNIFFFKETFWANIGKVMEIDNDTIYVLGNDENVQNINLYKLNMEGDSLDMLEYGGFEKDVLVGRDIIGMDGYLYLPVDMYMRPATTEFLKIDKKGNIIKRSKLEEFAKPEIHNYFGGFIKTLDNNFVFGKIDNDIANWYGGLFSSDLCKFDKDFNILWTKNMTKVATGRLFSFTQLLTPAVDTGFYASVTIPFEDSMWMKKYEDRKIANWPVIFYKLDKDGNVEWTDTIFNYRYQDRTYPRRKVWHLKTLKNGDMVGCGYIEEPVYPPVTSFRGWLFSYSKEGELKWEHYYQYNGNDTTFILDVVECGNGDLLCTGEIKRKDISDFANKEMTWLFRVDSNGCYVPGCMSDTLSAVYTATEELSHPSLINILELYPNPVSDVLYINIPEKARSEKGIYWEIYDFSGKIIKKGVHNGYFERLSITGLSDFEEGIYYVIVKSKKRLIGVGKFVK